MYHGKAYKYYGSIVSHPTSRRSSYCLLRSLLLLGKLNMPRRCALLDTDCSVGLLYEGGLGWGHCAADCQPHEVLSPLAQLLCSRSGADADDCLRLTKFATAGSDEIFGNVLIPINRLAGCFTLARHRSSMLRGRSRAARTYLCANIRRCVTHRLIRWRYW